MAALAPLDRALRADATARPPVVLVVGPPRSGTTLLYELLVTGCRFAYFSNAAHRLHRSPVAATRLFRPVIRRWRGSFESEHGRIRGWGAPCEAGWIWNRWMPGSAPMDETDVGAMPVETMRRTVGAIARILDAPFLTKNVNHSVRLRALDAVFPGCIVIEIRRDDADTIRSIYRLRRSRSGEAGVRSWLSVKPRAWARMRDAGPIEQIAAQVQGVRADIEHDIRWLGAERRLVLSYESLCRDPRGELERIERFLGARGMTIQRRQDIPESFDRPVSRPLDEALEERIGVLLQHGPAAAPYFPTIHRDPLRVAA